MFSDIEGSTRRWDAQHDAMQTAVRRHDAIMRQTIEGHGGAVFKTVGDAFCAIFATAPVAVASALAAQRALAAEDWSAVDGLRVRMALHAGDADERDADYFGPTVNRVARLLATGHGGQVLLSAVVAELCEGSLPAEVALLDLGQHRLKDLSHPEHVYQLNAEGLVQDFPPLRSLGARPNNLPVQLTSFIGREHEIDEINKLLETHRAVTVIGSGGVGKTRTALQVGAQELDRRDDGVWFVDFARLSDGSLVASIIAQALNLSLPVDAEPMVAISRLLRRLRTCLILDNCEHLIEPVANTVSTILHSCPNVAVIATSRQSLGIGGEVLFRLPSLSFPAIGQPVESATAAAAYAAVQLFAVRAAAVDSRFKLTNENAQIICDICARLDGIALAIELAAARASMLTPRQLREHLNERFRILTGGGRDALPRQQTMRATIDWSYGLLSETERMLLRRLSVFTGGWSLEAAQIVCSDGSLDALDIFDLQASLVEKSLVVTELGESDSRFRLLESTRAYGFEKLQAAGEPETYRSRHAHWVGAFAEEQRDLNWKIPVARWLPPVLAELDNIRTALQWSLGERGDVVLGARITGALMGLWFVLPEGRRWIEAALAAVDPAEHPDVVARLDLCLGLVVTGLPGLQAAARALAMYQSLNDPFYIAWSYRQLAMCQLQAGQGKESLESSERAIATFREASMTGAWPYAVCLGLRAAALALKRQFVEARAAFSEAIALFESLDDAVRAAYHKLNFAQLEFACGNTRDALALTTNAAAVIHLSHDFGRESAARGNAAACYLALGEIEKAAVEARSSLVLAQRTQYSLALTFAVQHLAAVAALCGDTTRAAHLLGYVDAWFAKAGAARHALEQRSYEILTAELTKVIPSDRLTQLCAQGARLDEDGAVSEALTVPLAPITGR